MHLYGAWPWEQLQIWQRRLALMLTFWSTCHDRRGGVLTPAGAAAAEAADGVAGAATVCHLRLLVRRLLVLLFVCLHELEGSVVHSILTVLLGGTSGCQG